MSDSDQFSIEMGGRGARGLSEREEKGSVPGRLVCACENLVWVHSYPSKYSGTLGHAGTTHPRLSFPCLPEISKAGVSILNRLPGVSPLVELPDPRSNETHPEQWIDFAAQTMIRILDSLVGPEDLSDEYLQL